MSVFCRTALAAALSCLALGAPAATVETFGMDGRPAQPAAQPPAPAPKNWIRTAQILEKRGDWPGLLAWGREWAQADARDPVAWFVQGRALGELGRLDEAIAAYQRNLRLAPDDVMARNNLGDAWRESGRPREAMQAYRAAVETDADYLPAWRNLGLTFYQVKGEAGVTQALQKLQAVDPELAEVWRALAVEYAVTQDERVARKALRVWRGLSQARRARMFWILFDEG